MTLHNVTVGDNCCIENVKNYIANYEIGAYTFIENVDIILVESTRTRTRFSQDPLWRIQGTWPRVHTDKNPVLSGPTVENSGGHSPASTQTRTQFPQDPLWRIQGDVAPRPH